MQRKPKILAHRGASAYAPENTMEALLLAVEQHADGFEIDIHLTKDGEIVLIHDETIDRTSDGKGDVGAYTLDELRKFNFNKRFEEKYPHAQIPTLKQVLKLVKDRDLILNIEVKNILSKARSYESLGLEAARLVRKYGVEEQIVFSSFNHGSMVSLKQAYPEMNTGLLHFAGLYRAGRYAKTAGADALHPLYIGVSEESVAEAHAEGVAVNVWTVNDKSEIVRMINAGADAIITDVPDTVFELREGESS